MLNTSRPDKQPFQLSVCFSSPTEVCASLKPSLAGVTPRRGFHYFVCRNNHLLCSNGLQSLIYFFFLDFFFFFLIWTIFKVFIEFVTILLPGFFMFCFFGSEVCGTLTPQPGIEPAPPALEGAVLTIGPPGKSLQSLI